MDKRTYQLPPQGMICFSLWLFLSLWTHVVSAEPRKVWQKAVQFSQQGQCDKSIPLVQQLLQSASQLHIPKAQMFALLAFCYHDQAQLKEAAHALHQAFDLDPHASWPNMNQHRQPFFQREKELWQRKRNPALHRGPAQPTVHKKPSTPMLQGRVPDAEVRGVPALPTALLVVGLLGLGTSLGFGIAAASSDNVYKGMNERSDTFVEDLMAVHQLTHGTSIVALVTLAVGAVLTSTAIGLFVTSRKRTTPQTLTPHHTHAPVGSIHNATRFWSDSYE